jgi:YD repeat-containing protein
VRKVIPAVGPGVTYAYDPLDRLISADYGSAVTTLTYDWAGRKLSQDDPDLGEWSYTYDAVGSLKTQADARGCVTTLDYDALNRLTGKTYSGCPSSVAATGAVTYSYDSTADGNAGKGRRTGMSDASGTNAWACDSPAGGRSVLRGQVVTGYTPHGGVQSVDSPLWASYLSSASYDAAGRVVERTYGNGTKTAYTYHPWTTQGGRLQNVTSTKFTTPAATWQNLAYGYDPNGNISNGFRLPLAGRRFARFQPDGSPAAGPILQRPLPPQVHPALEARPVARGNT